MYFLIMFKTMYNEQGGFKFIGKPREAKDNLILREITKLNSGDIYYGYWYKLKLL